MKDWVPFFQTLIWPAFLGAALWIFRSPVSDVVLAIKRRIEAGAEMALGPGGITLGSAPVLKNEEATKKEKSTRESADDPPYLAGAIYLVHSAKFARSVPEGKDYKITVRTYAETSELEDAIERVEYHLHRSYRRRVRESTDQGGNFELSLYAWGQFNLKAHVYLKGKDKPVVLWRFLNF